LLTQLDENWTGWGQTGMRFGSNNYRSGSVQLGLKYSW
jgi:outer membrane autotransporter protein